jgi:hypothetical protein
MAPNNKETQILRLFVYYLRRFFENRVYTIKAASIIATNPIFPAASVDIPNKMQRFVTKPLVSSAIKIKNTGRHKLYLLIFATLLPL